MRGSGVTTIAHVSDLHLAPVPFPFGEGLKPALGWINWRRKPGAHDPALGLRVAAAVRAASPDHVALTGDLIELGLASEYGAAAEALAASARPAGSPGPPATMTSTRPRRAAAARWPRWLARAGCRPAECRRYPRPFPAAGGDGTRGPRHPLLRAPDLAFFRRRRARRHPAFPARRDAVGHRPHRASSRDRRPSSAPCAGPVAAEAPADGRR